MSSRGRDGQETVLPDAVGLCPVHQEEFFFPIKLPLMKPIVRCPAPGCDKFLMIYIRGADA